MDCDLCDIRPYDAQGSLDKIKYIFEYSRKDLWIIIGHGDDQGNTINGVDFSELESQKKSILWLYACNSGIKICNILSNKGINTIGFVTEIIISKEENPREVRMIIDHLLDFNEKKFVKIISYIKDFYKKQAFELLKSGNILDASILSHTRLALRAFPGKNKT